MSLFIALVVTLVPLNERVSLTGVSKVNLDLSIGISTLVIKPSSGESIEVSGEYDPEYIKKIAINPEYHDNGVLDLEMKVEPIKSFKNIARKSRGKITVSLPVQPSYEIDMGIGVGEADVDLGGLPITELEINCGVGELVVNFSNPNPEAGGRFKLRTGVGETTLKKLGNGNFKVVDIQTGISDHTIDLSGSWDYDGKIEIEGAMTNIEFSAPSSLGIRVNHRGFLNAKDIPFKKVDDYYQTDNYEEASKRLKIEFQGFMSNVEFNFSD